MNIPNHLQLADPEFDQPKAVDLLLGVGTTLAALCQGQIQLNDPKDPDLIAQETRFGWVIGGSSLSTNRSVKKYVFQSCISTIEKQLKDFWEMDDVISTKPWSSEETTCEEHFKRNVTRDATGRYIVSLPFNERKNELFDSRESARNRFRALLRKFKRSPDLEREYSAVIKEYLELGHLSEIKGDARTEREFFLPHHAVIKSTSLTTKVRVVFDGSCRGENRVSLNEALMVGPTIQTDLFSLLTRFRTHQYVMTGDIEKMYRQFWVRDEDRDYQKIWWKKESGEEGIFRLNTITFGISSAPIRCIHQLADDEGAQFPSAAKVIKRDLYVDDLLTGTDSLEEACKLRVEIIQLLQRGQLNIRQWVSNNEEILNGLPEGSINFQLKTSDDATVKTLGLYWDSARDEIVYTIKPLDINARTTKRTMLSEVSKIFDPLGFLGPVIVKGRIILHQLWMENLGWDDAIPLSILTEWRKYAKELPNLNNISFNRKMIISEACEIQLHGFCDASERGYGACLYLRTKNIHGTTRVELVCSKYRVAPIKTVSLPRLELCAALLLANLYRSTRQAIIHKIDKIILWSDSMVTLHWINTAPHKLLVFVANRVASIQERTNGIEWRHVRSKGNPADHISRGLFLNEFKEISNWKNGPEWLAEDETTWPESGLTIISDLPEIRKSQCLIILVDKGEQKNDSGDEDSLPYILRFSSIGRLRRLFAMGMRFKNKLRGAISARELDEANTRIIKIIQDASFSSEIKELKRGHKLSKGLRWQALDPFVDEKGCVRVGGRLKNASLPFDQKHPLLLPKGHHVTEMLIRNEHVTNCHSGSQTTLYALRKKYWLIDGRQQVRKVIKNCVTCIRAEPLTAEYTMGNIPKTRVTEARPFCNVRVDYCGPFYIKEKKHRNRNRIKVWVAVFVCLVIKAVHLEVVTDLTTEGFMAAFKRFIGRRGKPKNIYSDNGTNFVGANNEIKELYSFLQSRPHNEKMHHRLAEQGIIWHFIPPVSPHFGGLWDAGVKFFKYHLKRIVDDLVTFEQFNTLIIEIEAILNSRPLTPISSDPKDLLVLTPGHFLTGDSLTGLPEPDLTDTPKNRLSVWQFIQKKQQEFWKRWHKEYLNEQNQRYKWNRGSHGIKEGSIVIIREDNLPPRQWSLGRVIHAHRGQDGVIRVVKLKTAKGEIERNIRKLSPLLCDNEQSISE